MIILRQKDFSEYDAMRSLYVEILRRTGNDRGRRFPVIDQKALLPILKGNNVVIERFVICTSLFGRDKYRMYLKIGAKAKLPDEVRLPGRYYDESLINAKVRLSGSLPGRKDPNQQVNNLLGGNVRTFSRNKNKNKNGGGDNGGGGSPISTFAEPMVDIRRTVTRLLGNAVKYDKRSRELVIETASIEDAIEALNILPFGIDYKIYLLNA